ncbi:hypothetical protein [Rhizobium phaseoli]|uniref:hypothetical protein n=1 Tax=Rhizobium phaseoli TaxID=396 RepID=UPI0007E95B6A|nr:hypothetical protein [Rhizobium phaseoli]ANL35177.1 hypothetical protein AMC89_CH03141 [Rhizobium phaseoli]ANL98900.1 hypothetical protein AMC79_CH03131 [Rhizobium phaseoli]
MAISSRILRLYQKEQKQESGQAVDASSLSNGDGHRGTSPASGVDRDRMTRWRSELTYSVRGTISRSFKFAVENMEVVMVDPRDREPAEGSRETVERELARQGETQHSSAEKGGGQKGPAQQSPRKK